MTPADVDKFMSDRPYLVYMNCLLKLAHTNIKQICTECQSEVNLKTNKVGSALYLTWVSYKLPCFNNELTIHVFDICINFKDTYFQL